MSNFPFSIEMSTVSSRTSEPQDNSGSTAFYAYIILGSLGVIGNASVCLVMLRYRNVFNSSTNKLIIHQSFVDFLASLVFLLRRFLIISPPAVVPDNILGSLYCKLWWSEWPQYGMFVASTYNLVAISLERYLATCQPVRHRNMFSMLRLKLIMAASWVCGLIPELHNLVLVYEVNNTCDVFWLSFASQAGLGVFIFLKDLIIPITIIIFAYSKIIFEIRKRSKARVCDNNRDAQKMLSKANKNVTKTLLLVAVLFAICWIPTEISYIMYNLGVNPLNSTVFEAMGAIVVVNLCVNPFIYCFTYERFQTQVKKMVCGGCQPRGNQVDVITDGSTRHDANEQHTARHTA